MKKFKEFIEEDAPAMTASSPPIAGLPPDLPPVGKGITTAGHMLRRKPPSMFGGKAVFKVPSDAFHKARLGKGYRKHYKSYVSGDLGEEIRQYALENPEAPIIVEDEKTGAMMYLRYGK